MKEMTRKRGILGGLVGAVLIGLVSMAQAELIYQHSFGGLSADSLNGVAVDERPGTETWTSSDVIKADGSLAGGTSNSAWLDFSPEQGKVYTFSANVTSTALAGQSYWLGIGFLTSAADVATSPLGVAHIGIKRDGNVITSVNGGSYGGTSDERYWNDGAGMTVDLTMVLDTSASDWIVTYLANDVEIRTYTFVGNDLGITGVGIGKSTWASGSFNEMELTVVPEPATIGLLGASGLIIMLIRRRMII